MNIEAAVMKVPYFEARSQYEHYRALVKERPQHAAGEALARPALPPSSEVDA
jgi:hypothetical protein